MKNEEGRQRAPGKAVQVEALPRVSMVRFHQSTPELRESGLLGWISFNLAGNVRVDGVALRRTREGRHTLSFPARRDELGRTHPYLRPLDDATRLAIEGQVLEALGFGAEG